MAAVQDFHLPIPAMTFLTCSSVVIDPMIMSMHLICSLDHTLYSDTKNTAEITDELSEKCSLISPTPKFRVIVVQPQKQNKGVKNRFRKTNGRAHI